MTVLDWFKDGEPKLTIGDFKFEILIALSDTTERDPAKDKAEFKKSTARAVVWFVDNCRFHNYKLWHTNKTKEEKLQDFNTALVLSDDIQTLMHTGLNAIGIKYGRVIRAEKEYQKHIIIVSFDIEIYKDLPEKKKERVEKTLAEPTETTATEKAAAAKTSQAQADQLQSNEFLKAIDGLLKRLWE